MMHTYAYEAYLPFFRVMSQNTWWTQVQYSHSYVIGFGFHQNPGSLDAKLAG